MRTSLTLSSKLVTAALAVFVMVLALLTATPSAAVETTSPVVVSLTFDDGLDDQTEGAALMNRYGLRGTFYVNSPRLGQPGFLTSADLAEVAAAGHEIGGHTLTHTKLTALDTESARQQVCDDRAALREMGYAADSFAYPFAADNATVRDIVKDCGYASARDIGGLVSPTSCFSCPYAESIPPQNVYAIRAPSSIKKETTLAEMQDYVTRAEQNGGGWVVLTIHYICDGCDPYSVTAERLDAFLSWLSARAAHGTTVRTVTDVMTGPTPPSVDPAGANLLANPSMEADDNADGLPECWKRGGYGTNTYTWSVASDARTGSRAMRVDISAYTSGDRKILTAWDSGACAPPATDGASYSLAGWYKSEGTARVSAYYRDSSGTWRWYAQSPLLTASPNTYRQMTWTVPAAPTGATHISVGFSLRSVGFVQADDVFLAVKS